MQFSGLEERSRSFPGLAGFTSDVFNLTGAGDPEQLPAARVSWNFFAVLGVSAVLGRSFTAAEGQPQGDRVALLSHRLWERRFGSDRAIPGRHIALDSKDYTMVGVLPPDFTFAALDPAVEIYIPRPDELNLMTPAQVQGGVMFLRRYWPRENPIGKHMYIGNLTPIEVVGVLAEVRNVGLAADVQPEVDFPYAQRAWPSIYLIARTAGDPQTMVTALRARVLAIDRDQPVTAVRTMDEVLEDSAAQPRFTAALLGSLSAIALLLAIVGMYAMIACSGAERTQEMGIRMALGAGRADILRMVLRQGLGLALAGIAAGLAASLALTRLLASLLYRVSVTDTLTYSAGIGLFLSVAVLASYLPARRATRVDPMVALR